MVNPATRAGKFGHWCAGHAAGLHPQGYSCYDDQLRIFARHSRYWMLLADWRNGSFAILLAVGVLLVGCALATRNRMPAAEGPMFREGPDPSPPVQTAVPLDRITE